jgi:hypothetical protein
MSQVAQKHHFVPQCYLAGFTDGGSKTGKLCVFDFQVRRFFRTKPKNVAFEIDFNRFETNNYLRFRSASLSRRNPHHEQP